MPIWFAPRCLAITDPIAGRMGSALAPGEWRLLGWLEREEFAYDLYSETELHFDRIDLDRYRVLVFDRNGNPLRKWNMPESEVGNPEGICVLSDGDIAVADTHYHRVVVFDDSGRVQQMIGQEGQDDGDFYWPVAVIEDDRGHRFVSEYGGANRVQKFDRDWRHLLTFGGIGDLPGEFQRPSGMVWHAGRLYIVDAFNDRIQVFDGDGQFVEILGTRDESGRLHYPYDIALGPDRDLWVVEYGAGRISRFSLEGDLLGRFGSTGSGRNQFGTPWGLAIDSKRRIWVADTRNHRLVSIDL